MTTKEITQLPLGSKVFLIQNAEIQAWQTIGFHPAHPLYFYLSGNGSISKTKCLWLDSSQSNFDNRLVWEKDYEKAKEVMWEQLKRVVESKNKIFMDNQKVVDFIN